MKGPGDPVEQSYSPPGDMAKVPPSVTINEVTDQEDDNIGVLIKWDSAEWFWADIDSYVYLENAR